MDQVKIYGLWSSLANRKQALSDAIHESLMENFGLPREKRFHRFILMEKMSLCIQRIVVRATPFWSSPFSRADQRMNLR